MNIWGLKKQIDALRKRKATLKGKRDPSTYHKIKKIDAAIAKRRWKIKKLREQKPKKK